MFVLIPALNGEKRKIAPQRNICTQAISGSIHWHSAVVPNLIQKLVASGWFSKFESLIKVVQVEITGCECHDLSSTVHQWASGLISNKDIIALKKLIIHSSSVVSLWHCKLYSCNLKTLCLLKMTFYLCIRCISVLCCEHLFILMWCARQEIYFCLGSSLHWNWDICLVMSSPAFLAPIYRQ